MRKIHPGFIALAVLLGPATIIRGHQVVSDYLSQGPAQGPDPLQLAQHIYQKCSGAPGSQRSAQCDEYVSWYDQCVTSSHTCDLHSAPSRLIDLNILVPDIELPSPQEATLATAADG